MAMIIISRRMKKTSSSSRRRFHVTIRSLLLLSLLCCLCFQQASAHGGIDDGDDDSPSPVAHDHATNTKGLVAVKVWCLVILLVSTFVAGVSPYFLRWNEAFLVLGTQFAAGVFLGTSLMHFLADSTETFRALVPSKHYPFSFMLTCVGFLLTMLADCAILAVAKRSRDQVRANNNDNDEEEEQAQDQGRGRHPYPSKDEDEDEDHHHPLSVVTRTSSFEDAVLLVLALCFHSVFEGIAIGVSPTKSDAWRNLWTIGLHKVFAAVAMGIALLRFLPKRPLLASVAYSLAFAVSSPVGVGIGIGVIDAAPQARAWVYAVSMGLATGIFVYVAVNHLMAKGYRPHRPCRADRPFFKFLAVLLGVAVMAVAMIWD